MGTEEKPIIFTSNTGKEETQPYQAWSGISIQKADENYEPEFYHCYIDHASIWSKRGIIIENSYVNHSYGISVFGDNKWKAVIKESGVSSHAGMGGGISGFYISECSKVEIINNRLSGNSSHIMASGNDVICEENQLSDNGGIFIGARDGHNSFARDNVLENAELHIRGNFTVEDNYISNPDAEYALSVITHWNPVINNNVIIGNVSLNGNIQERPVDLRYNYWGTVDSEKINKSIQRNPYDDIVHEYEYEPYLDEDMNIYVYQPPDDDDDPDGKLMIVLIIIGVICVILVILIFLIFLIKKRSKENPYVEEEIVTAIELVNQ